MSSDELDDLRQQLDRVRDLAADLHGITGARWIADILDTILDTRQDERAGDDLGTKLKAVLRDLHDAAVAEERDYPMRANATWDAIEQIQQAVGIDELWPSADVVRGGGRT